MDESGGDVAGEGDDSSRLDDSWAAAAADARADARARAPGAVARAQETLQQAQGEWQAEGFSFTSHSAYSCPPPASSAAAPGGEQETQEGLRRRGSWQPAAADLQTTSLRCAAASLLGHVSLASHSDFPESVVRRQRAVAAWSFVRSVLGPHSLACRGCRHVPAGGKVEERSSSDGRVLWTRAGSMRQASKAARVVGSGPGRRLPLRYPLQALPCLASRPALLPPD